MRTACDPVAGLRARIDRLEEENAALRAALTVPVLYPRAWRLTPAEEIIVGTLIARPMVTREAMLTALENARRSSGEAEPKVIDVYMTRIRHKLGPHGIQVHTRRACRGAGALAGGFYLDADVRDRLRAQLLPATGGA